MSAAPDPLAVIEERIKTIPVWLCDECGYWRQERSTGRHVAVNPEDPNGHMIVHDLREVHFVRASALASLKLERDTIAKLETWLAGEHLAARTPREETITRRVLWAIRGSNDDPPHPDRAALDTGAAVSAPEDVQPMRSLTEYEIGYINGLAAFAWWKDGSRYVGTIGSAFTDAVRNFLMTRPNPYTEEQSEYLARQS